jgi:hypothetical protein
VSLCFQGPDGEVEERWIIYALLRDNIQHHLEHGAPSKQFEAIHRAGGALGGGRVTLNALQLRVELGRAQGELIARPISELAVSARTRAVIERTWPVRGQRFRRYRRKPRRRRMNHHRRPDIHS